MCEKHKQSPETAEMTEKELEGISGGTTTPPQEAIDEGLYLGAIVVNDGAGCDKCGNNQFRVTEFYPMGFVGACTKCGAFSFGQYKVYGGGGWSVG